MPGPAASTSSSNRPPARLRQTMFGVFDEFLKPPAAQIAEHNVRRLRCDAGNHLRINHASGEEQIGQAVVIEIRDGGAPAYEAVLDSEPGPQGGIVKVALTVIAVKNF